MDRFIVPSQNKGVLYMIKFKIQYGQIYSMKGCEKMKEEVDLKSNMDRFIARQVITEQGLL